MKPKILVLLLTIVAGIVVVAVSGDKTPSEAVEGLFISWSRVATDPQLHRAGPNGGPLLPSHASVIILELKDSDGIPRFCSKAAKERGIASIRECRSVGELVTPLVAAGFKVVAYLQVFKDRAFAERFPAEAMHDRAGTLFKDKFGAFVDPVSEPYQSYFLELVQEAADSGASGVMLDYVRYAEPLYQRQAIYPHSARLNRAEREQVITRFVARVRNILDESAHTPELWAAVFPMGRGVSQDLASLSRVVDVICPMLYPEVMTHQGRSSDSAWKQQLQRLLVEYRRNSAGSRAAGERVARLVPFLQAFSFRSAEPLPKGQLAPRLMQWQLQLAQREGFPVALFNYSGAYQSVWWDH